MSDDESDDESKKWRDATETSYRLNKRDDDWSFPSHLYPFDRSVDNGYRVDVNKLEPLVDRGSFYESMKQALLRESLAGSPYLRPQVTHPDPYPMGIPGFSFSHKPKIEVLDVHIESNTVIVTYEAPDRTTGKPVQVTTMKTVVDSVQDEVRAALQAAFEHEIDELILYCGQRIFDPHR